jgi:hypothetical protein
MEWLLWARKKTTKSSHLYHCRLGQVIASLQVVDWQGPHTIAEYVIMMQRRRQIWECIWENIQGTAPLIAITVVRHSATCQTCIVMSAPILELVSVVKFVGNVLKRNAYCRIIQFCIIQRNLRTINKTSSTWTWFRLMGKQLKVGYIVFLILWYFSGLQTGLQISEMVDLFPKMVNHLIHVHVTKKGL